MMGAFFSNNINRAYAIIHNECEVKTECKILIDSIEPIGLPGFFFYSASYGYKFNAWKRTHTKGRYYWNHYYKELEFIDSSPEVLYYAFGTDEPKYLYRWKREAIRIPVPTTICIEALVKAGYCGHNRVRRAINTLIDFKDNNIAYEKDYECSCPIAKADLYIYDNNDTPDFENIKTFPLKNSRYFYAPLVRRALLYYPGFIGSKLDMDIRDKKL